MFSINLQRNVEIHSDNKNHETFEQQRQNLTIKKNFQKSYKLLVKDFKVPISCIAQKPQHRNTTRDRIEWTCENVLPKCLSFNRAFHPSEVKRSVRLGIWAPLEPLGLMWCRSLVPKAKTTISYSKSLYKNKLLTWFCALSSIIIRLLLQLSQPESFFLLRFLRNLNSFLDLNVCSMNFIMCKYLMFYI